MIQQKLIPGRYINLPTQLTGQANPPAGTNVGEFVEMTSVPLRLEQSTKDPGLGGHPYSAVHQGVHDKIHRNFQYLRYIVYRTTFMNISGIDVMTGFMQGCRVVVFSDNGRKYVAHIGTGQDVQMNTATKNAWNAFARMPGVQILAGFNPWAQWSNNMPQAQPGDHFTGVKCVALVTSTLELYSVALFKHENNLEAFRVHDVVQMQSMAPNELMNI
jgi:hypothetical protein